MDAKKEPSPLPRRRPSGQKKTSQTKPARLRSCLSQTGAEKLWHRSRERKTFVLTSYVALHLAKAEKPAFYLVSRKLTSAREMFPPPSTLHFLASVWGNFLSFFFPPSVYNTHTTTTRNYRSAAVWILSSSPPKLPQQSSLPLLR